MARIVTAAALLALCACSPSFPDDPTVAQVRAELDRVMPAMAGAAGDLEWTTRETTKPCERRSVESFERLPTDEVTLFRTMSVAVSDDAVPAIRRRVIEHWKATGLSIQLKLEATDPDEADDDNRFFGYSLRRKDGAVELVGRGPCAMP